MVQPSFRRKTKNQSLVLEFLEKHKTQAYTQTELANVLNIKHHSAVFVALHALQHRGYVAAAVYQKKIYWRITDEGIHYIRQSNQKISSETPTDTQTETQGNDGPTISHRPENGQNLDTQGRTVRSNKNRKKRKKK
jgi:DNA-binding PadR family transcriptional regulator